MLDFIAYLIISIALGALILNILRFFNIIEKRNTNGSTCVGCETGCEMKELHQFNKDKPTNYDQYRMQL